MSILDTLAQFAETSQTTRRSATPVYELNIEEARAAVTCGDRAKEAAEDGSQQLILRLSRRKLKLDPVKVGADFIAASAEQVEEFSGLLLDAVKEGAFDEQIVEVQGLLREAANKPKDEKVAVEAEPEGLDLSELDEEVEAIEEDLDDLA